MGTSKLENGDSTVRVMKFTNGRQYHSELCNLGLFEEHLGRGDDGDEDGGG